MTLNIPERQEPRRPIDIPQDPTQQTPVDRANALLDAAQRKLDAIGVKNARGLLAELRMISQSQGLSDDQEQNWIRISQALTTIGLPALEPILAEWRAAERDGNERMQIFLRAPVSAIFQRNPDIFVSPLMNPARADETTRFAFSALTRTPSGLQTLWSVLDSFPPAAARRELDALEERFSGEAAPRDPAFLKALNAVIKAGNEAFPR